MKKGFTLVELLTVIFILGILVTLAVPNVLEAYDKSLKKAMVTQENKLSDAANLLIKDFCYSPINDEKKGRCKELFKTTTDGTYRYVCIETLKAEEYTSSNVEFNEQKCSGFVIYKYDNVSKKYGNAKTLLFCGESGKSEYNSELDGADYPDFALEKFNCDE